MKTPFSKPKPDTVVKAGAKAPPPVIDRPFTSSEVPALLAYLRKI